MMATTEQKPSGVIDLAPNLYRVQLADGLHFHTVQATRRIWSIQIITWSKRSLEKSELCYESAGISTTIHFPLKSIYSK